MVQLQNNLSEIQIYQFRKDNPQYIVTVYSVEEIKQEFLCASSEGARVVT